MQYHSDLGKLHWYSSVVVSFQTVMLCIAQEINVQVEFLHVMFRLSNRLEFTWEYISWRS